MVQLVSVCFLQRLHGEAQRDWYKYFVGVKGIVPQFFNAVNKKVLYHIPINFFWDLERHNTAGQNPRLNINIPKIYLTDIILCNKSG